MSVEVDRFRLLASQTLGRLAETEERLCADAEREGDETLSLIHEHGALCLRQAQDVVWRLGRE